MKISVIIVNYNTGKLLSDCLSSLLAHTRNLEMEVIVVDNASTDGSGEMVKKNFPQVVLIENQENLGFAGGNNLGMKKAKGEYCLLLNSDTRLVEDSLKRMLEFMERHTKVGISSCQLVDDKGGVQPSGGFFPNLGRILAWMFFFDDLPLISQLIKPFHPHAPKFYLNDLWYQTEHFQDWVTGAFFLIRRRVMEEIGFLDENFFMYVEEMEYCYRAKIVGWQIAYTPCTKIIHLGGKSGGEKRAILGEYQGLKYFFAKHKPSWQMPLLRIFLKSGALLRLLLFDIIGRSKEAKQTYVEAFKLA